MKKIMIFTIALIVGAVSVNAQTEEDFWYELYQSHNWAEELQFLEKQHLSIVSEDDTIPAAKVDHEKVRQHNSQLIDFLKRRTDAFSTKLKIDMKTNNVSGMADNIWELTGMISDHHFGWSAFNFQLNWNFAICDSLGNLLPHFMQIGEPWTKEQLEIYSYYEEKMPSKEEVINWTISNALRVLAEAPVEYDSLQDKYYFKSWEDYALTYNTNITLCYTANNLAPMDATIAILRDIVFLPRLGNSNEDVLKAARKSND